MSISLNNRLARSVDRAILALAVFAGISLLFMMATITVSVLTPYLLNMPITGIDEIVQMTGVGLIMLALPYATLHDAHVRVDIFDDWLGHDGRRFGDVLSRLLCSCALLVLVSRGVMPFLGAMIIVLILIIAFPQIALFLPNSMLG